jgi:Predicted nucleic-acid-binding protein containing a Zn-ribbon
MTTRDAGYDEWVDALADGRGYALVCPEGHGSLPPRRTCPECGATTFSEEPLPERGTVETVTVVHVPPPQFADDAPYATAIAAFGPVRLTGVLRGVDVGEKELSGDGDDDDDTAGDATPATPTPLMTTRSRSARQLRSASQPAIPTNGGSSPFGRRPSSAAEDCSPVARAQSLVTSSTSWPSWSFVNA